MGRPRSEGRCLRRRRSWGGETDANRTVFLISDGHNTEGETPESVVPALTAQGTRVFTISTGGASNDPTLGGIASMTRGATLDARDSRTLVNAFVRQFAVEQRRDVDPALSVFGEPGEPGEGVAEEPPRSSSSWVLGKDEGAIDPKEAPVNNLFGFLVEEGTERIALAFAGNMDDMSGFGVRAQLDGPSGGGASHFDTDVPDPSMQVTNDGFFTLVEIKNPNPGDWLLSLEASGAGADVQTGNVTIVTENPMVDLFTSVDRTVVTDPSKPVRLSIRPHYLTELRDPEKLIATVKLPDGTVETLSLFADPNSTSGQAFEADIKNMPLAGHYEVRVYMRTGAMTTNDPGESLFANSPSAAVPVPVLERTATESFYVKGTTFACPGGSKDCDGDCLSEDKKLDSDGDGVPDDFDIDADDDEIPDFIEARQCEPVDTDGDQIPDYLDTDSDNDDVLDSTDNCRVVSNTDQADGDADQWGDACDNCAKEPNPDQADADADGEGDLCDETPGTGGAGGVGGSGTGNKDCNCSTPGRDPEDPLGWLLLCVLPLGVFLREARRRMKAAGEAAPGRGGALLPKALATTRSVGFTTEPQRSMEVSRRILFSPRSEKITKTP
ncbi:MAG: VWA domain-containing protein [Polyangiaceae bacterium]